MLDVKTLALPLEKFRMEFRQAAPEKLKNTACKSRFPNGENSFREADVARKMNERIRRHLQKQPKMQNQLRARQRLLFKGSSRNIRARHCNSAMKGLNYSFSEALLLINGNL